MERKLSPPQGSLTVISVSVRPWRAQFSVAYCFQVVAGLQLLPPPSPAPVQTPAGSDGGVTGGGVGTGGVGGGGTVGGDAQQTYFTCWVLSGPQSPPPGP